MEIDNLILWLSAIKKTADKMGASPRIYIAENNFHVSNGICTKLHGVHEDIVSHATEEQNNELNHRVVLTYIKQKK